MEVWLLYFCIYVSMSTDGRQWDPTLRRETYFLSVRTYWEPVSWALNSTWCQLERWMSSLGGNCCALMQTEPNGPPSCKQNPTVHSIPWHQHRSLHQFLLTHRSFHQHRSLHQMLPISLSEVQYCASGPSQFCGIESSKCLVTNMNDRYSPIRDLCHAW